MQLSNSLTFKGVCEWKNEFLALFPHRFDYIWAEQTVPGTDVEWKTESRHPLSDRLIKQGAYFYGVRFGAETNYCLIDIDNSSLYHPKKDSFAISRITAALEALGLVSYIACTSSYSDGLHLYFPFQKSQSSWQLAIAVACLLENAGFKLQPGQLEIFPNPKPYAIDNNFSLFNAHRLPLQSGSYLLDKAFQPIWSDTHTFVKQWQLVQYRNDVDSKVLKQVLKQAKRNHFGISGKAEKFINDLNAEIELGWTGSGQTNRLLGRITMRAYIFQHLLSGGEPLKGDALVGEIVETAQRLPGYQEWCSHQHEIEHRAQEWARCIENSHYFHFGEQSKKSKLEAQDPELITAIDQSPSWNQRQSATARDRIKRAIAELLETDSLPARPTARFQTLLKYGIGGGSLYRHRDLWHPNHFNTDIRSSLNLSDKPEALELYPRSFEASHQEESTKTNPNRQSSPSLLDINGGDNTFGKALSDCTEFFTPLDASNLSIPIEGRLSDSQPSQEVQYTQQALFNARASQEAFQEAARIAQLRFQHIRSEAAEQRQIDQMQEFLDSGDPILIAEAMAWAQVNPEVLNINQLQPRLSVDSQLQQSEHFRITHEDCLQSKSIDSENDQIE